MCVIHEEGGLTSILYYNISSFSVDKQVFLPLHFQLFEEKIAIFERTWDNEFTIVRPVAVGGFLWGY
jgi:hypothetical protein